MPLLTALLLLAFGAETKAETHYPGASEVFHCTFGSARNEEISGWPPGWTRRHGPGFPKYVRVRVDDNHPSAGGNSLRVELDGGAATAYSPAVSLNPDVQYVLEGYIKTNGLQHDGAYLSLIFLDLGQTKLSSISSEKISGTGAWQKIRLGPVSPPAGAGFMLVGLHVEPQGELQDLRGTASFGDLWLGQLPRIVLTAQPAKEMPQEQERPGQNWTDGKRLSKRNANDATFLLFSRGQPIEITCVVSGFTALTYEIRLESFDLDGRKLAEQRQSFKQLQPVSKTEKQKPSPFARMTWQLPGDSVGFYRVRATVVPIAPSVPSSSPQAGPTAAATSRAELSTNPRTICGAGVTPTHAAETAAPQEREVVLRQELNLAVIEPQSLPSGSEFGWSLHPSDTDLGLVPLGDLLCQCGIRWVKFPFTIQKPKESKANSLEPLINFSDRLGMAGVRLAGALLPPRATENAANRSDDLLAVEAFSRDPKTWYPAIEPVLARLAVEIRYWQIGDDRDPGWIGCRDLPGIVSRTKAELDRIGQDLDIGIAWNLASPLPMAIPISKADRSSNVKTPDALSEGANRRKTPWHFLSLPCDEAIDNDAMAKYLDDTKSADLARWMVLDTLPRKNHTAHDRIAHLVQRMLTAKMHGAEAIFISDPFDSDRGLVDRNGSPSELFLPWRTTALMLGGVPFVGDLDLSQGNQIHCFGGKGKYVGVLAGRKPGQETVYLGAELRTHDLWGNHRACPPTVSSDDGPAGLPPAPRSVIAVQQLPVFLVGLDGPITQWQLGVAFSPNRLASIPSALLPVTLELKNTFPQSISGRIKIRGPQNWYLEPRTAEFRLDPGASWKEQLEVALPNDVAGGRQMVRLDFEIQAERLYRFTMYRSLEVTLGDVLLEGQTALNNRGEMVVHQTLTNRGKKPAGFRCDLLAPDRRRQSTEVLIQPSSKSELKYCLPDGEQLLGKAIWLRAEEIDGPRVLNYRIETPAAAAPTTEPIERSKSCQPSRPGSSLTL